MQILCIFAHSHVAEWRGKGQQNPLRWFEPIYDDYLVFIASNR